MTFLHLERELRRLGEHNLADESERLRRHFAARGHGKDIAPLSSEVLLSPRSTDAESRQAVLPSLDRLVIIAKPRAEIVKAWKKKGFTNCDFFHLTDHQFEWHGDYPDWDFKPRSWFWQSVEEGKISRDATRLKEGLIAIDTTQKPNSDGGKQLYKNDPFGDLLRNLRKEGKIQVPERFKKIPETSRFGITPEELVEYVLPAIANMLGVHPDRVYLPTEMQLNIIGNRFHPEWGDKTAWELLQDRFHESSYLIGGRSDGAGLSNVDFVEVDGRNDNIGFRPVIDLS